ncbi:MAG: hypothetical protein QM733_20555 [Ilumatobacteraceae bacterium]
MALKMSWDGEDEVVVDYDDGMHHHDTRDECFDGWPQDCPVCGGGAARWTHRRPRRVLRIDGTSPCDDGIVSDYLAHLA